MASAETAPKRARKAPAKKDKYPAAMELPEILTAMRTETGVLEIALRAAGDARMAMMRAYHRAGLDDDCASDHGEGDNDPWGEPSKAVKEAHRRLLGPCAALESLCDAYNTATRVRRADAASAARLLASKCAVMDDWRGKDMAPEAAPLAFLDKDIERASEALEKVRAELGRPLYMSARLLLARCTDEFNFERQAHEYSDMVPNFHLVRDYYDGL